ncbi:hypothetical protein C8R45DRAFT_1127308 [Mycena sanguinolenta]|nr:hypothetical protein C8R45DRAFT_1127308 [Mycena sanguinolenta]
MQCSPPASRSTPRSSPASRARRRVVCILPPRPAPAPPSVRLITPDSTLLPYYHTSPVPDAPLIRSSPPFDPSPELRLPPVDPRKARRYCTDFGFARNCPTQPLPPLPPMYHRRDNSSSAGSTPQATYAETDSDASEASLYHLDFPQPPVSPALRRMQSSPLFTSEETDAVREFLRNRWRSQNNKTHLLPEQSPVSDYSWDAQSPDPLELAGEQLLEGLPEPSPGENWLHMTPPNLNVLSVPPPRRPRPSVLAPGTRALRRAASMADPPTPLLITETRPPPPPARSLRFQDAVPVPSLASAGRLKPTHRRANHSVPLMGLGIPDAARPALGTAFNPTVQRPQHHRSARSQPDLTRIAGAGAGPDPRSFIDFTPEKVVQRESTAHHKRIKRLLSRASSGFIGWGRALAGKKTVQ